MAVGASVGSRTEIKNGTLTCMPVGRNITDAKHFSQHTKHYRMCPFGQEVVHLLIVFVGKCNKEELSPLGTDLSIPYYV